MREQSWRNYDDPLDDDDEDDDEDPLAPIPPQKGFDSELWENRDDAGLGDIGEEDDGDEDED